MEEIASMETPVEVDRNLHGSRSNGSRWTLVEALRKELEVCDTRGSRWKYVGVYKALRVAGGSARYARSQGIIDWNGRCSRWSSILGANMQVNGSN